jgi:LysM repeat protein
MKEKQKDVLDTDDMNAVGEDYLNDLEYSSWRKTEESTPGPRLPNKSKLAFILLGVGVVVVVILAILLIPRGHNDTSAIQIRALEARLKQVEDKITGLEGVDKRLSQIEEQSKELATLRQRLDNLQTSSTSKIARPPEKVKEARYHKVQAGDTLYSISHRYGLTVEELRRLNKLAPGAVIHPDQKLMVSTGTGS